MARYKHIDTSPRFLPVDLAAQLLPGTFEHAAHHLLAHAVDLSRFDARVRNDDTGAPAYPPAMRRTVVRSADAHGIVSSRAIGGNAAQRCASRGRVQTAHDPNHPGPRGHHVGPAGQRVDVAADHSRSLDIRAPERAGTAPEARLVW